MPTTVERRDTQPSLGSTMASFGWQAQRRKASNTKDTEDTEEDVERATGPRSGPTNEKSDANAKVTSTAFVFAPLFPFVRGRLRRPPVARESLRVLVERPLRAFVFSCFRGFVVRGSCEAGWLRPRGKKDHPRLMPRPGRASVILPLSSTTWPLTMTYVMPTGACAALPGTPRS